MKMDDDLASGGPSSRRMAGMPLPTILFLVFLTLKLCGVISWSWWWVTAPLWGGVAVVVVVGVGWLGFILACKAVAGVARWWDQRASEKYERESR